jgi:multidrug efflux system membrane fusion protein
VTLGPVSGERVSIQDGLKPGERVVVDGLDKLRDGALVAVNEPKSRAAAPPGSAASQTLVPHRGASEARACETCVGSQLQ